MKSHLCFVNFARWKTPVLIFMRNDLISTPPAVCFLNIFNVIWGLCLLFNCLGEGGLTRLPTPRKEGNVAFKAPKVHLSTALERHPGDPRSPRPLGGGSAGTADARWGSGGLCRRVSSQPEPGTHGAERRWISPGKEEKTLNSV